MLASGPILGMSLRAGSIIFDSPPVLAVTDAAVLSKWVEGVIPVAEAGRTRRKAARQAIERLHQVGAHVLAGRSRS